MDTHQHGVYPETYRQLVSKLNSKLFCHPNWNQRETTSRQTRVHLGRKLCNHHPAIPSCKHRNEWVPGDSCRRCGCSPSNLDRLTPPTLSNTPLHSTLRPSLIGIPGATRGRCWHLLGALPLLFLLLLLLFWEFCFYFFESFGSFTSTSSTFASTFLRVLGVLLLLLLLYFYFFESFGSFASTFCCQPLPTI